jgi:hypothetical protein
LLLKLLTAVSTSSLKRHAYQFDNSANWVKIISS